ncbi:MAG: hypothetical protein FJZ67_09380 [Bacteroidetes bacterium]|nr:hypothetical protein [Bacteroidota bacterium]
MSARFQTFLAKMMMRFVIRASCLYVLKKNYPGVYFLEFSGEKDFFVRLIKP